MAGSPETLTYLHTDHLGTPKFGTDATGTQVWAWAPDAFGGGAPSGSVTVNVRMAGQYYDAESKLFYNWNRYYNPATGRYISSDPIGLNGGINTFLYAAASPVMYIDPEGLQAALACVGGPNPVCIAGIGQIISWIAGGAGLAAVMSVPGDTPAKKTPDETEQCTDDPEDSENLGPFKDNPRRTPDKYDPVNGRNAKQNKEDGSVWSKDKTSHGGEQWKRWDNMKSYERGEKPTSIWADGWIRK